MAFNAAPSAAAPSDAAPPPESQVAMRQIGGTISGLTGTVILQNNAGETLKVSSDGTFSFPTPVASGATYAVTVATQPTGQICSVSRGAGTVGANTIDDVAVVCASDSHTIGGAVSGLVGTVVLQNNGGETLAISADGPFTFNTPVAAGSSYYVTIKTQPSNLSCKATGANGTNLAANITTVAITCAVPQVVQLAPGTAFNSLSAIGVDANGNVYVTDFGSGLGNGAGRIFKIAPNATTATQVAVGTSIDASGGIAFDAGGNLFFSDAPNGKIYEIANGGTTAAQVVTGTSFSFPNGLAFDSAGDLFIASNGTGAGGTGIYKAAPGSSTAVRFSTVYGPRSLAMDPSGNLYMTRANYNGISFLAAGASTATDFAPAVGLSSPLGLAVDASGNIYVSTLAGGVGTIYKIAPGAPAPSQVSTGTVVPQAVLAMAVDSNGNLYFGDYSSNVAYEIVNP